MLPEARVISQGMGMTWQEDRFWLEESKKWLAKRAVMTMLLDDTDAVMTRAEFESLDEYSASTPGGTSVGKIWRAHRSRRYGGDDSWWLGEYYDLGLIDEVGIRWRRIHVVDVSTAGVGRSTPLAAAAGS